MNKRLYILCFLIISFASSVIAQYAMDDQPRFQTSKSLFSNILSCNLTVDAGADVLVCEEDLPVQINGSFIGNSLGYSWSPGANLSDPTILNPMATTAGTYTLTVQSVEDVNLVTNGDFENGDTGFTTDYSTGSANVGNYLVTDNPQNYFNLFSPCTDHTSGSGNMMIVDGSNIPNQNMWCQTVSLSANTDYYFSVWATMVGGTSPPELFFTANGNVISDTSSIPLTNCLWTEISQVWNSGSNTSIEFCIVNNNISPFGNDFAIDDILISNVCEVSDEVEVSVLAAVAIVGNETIACIGDCVTLDGSSSTSGPAIAHEWISVTGGPIQNGSTLTPTVCDTGVYKLIITSLDVPTNLYCYDSVLVLVDLATPNPLIPNFAGLDTLCQGTNTSYQIIAPDANTSNYEWIVDGGTIVDGQDSIIVEIDWTTTSAGEICVVASNSCELSDTTCMSIVINSPPAEPIISGQTNICNDPIATYSIPFSSEIINYSWTAPTGTLIQSGQGTEMMTMDWGSVTGGDVCLVIENNCGADSSCINVTFGSIQINIDSLNPLCSGDNNGWIKITPLAGTSPFSFIWGNGNMTDSIGDLSAGIYQVTVSDSDGCSTETSITLQDPPVLNLTFSNTDISCHGECDGVIATEVTGGTAPYTYSWGGGLGTNDSLLNVCNGIYNITITDANGCTIEGQTQLDNPPLITASILGDTIICEGGFVDITYQLTGIGPFDAELSDGSIHTNLMDGAIVSILPSATTTISIINLIDQGQPNCSVNLNSSISITVNEIPELPILTGMDSICQNTTSSYCMTNLINVDSFHWVIPSDATFVGQGTSCIDIDWGNSSGGIVCVEAINDCGGIQSCMDVMVFENPTSTFIVDPVICIDSTSTISYAGSASATANYIWDFDGGNIVSGMGEGPYGINWSIAGNYNITLTVEENGCTSILSTENVIVENPIPAPVINCTSTTNSVTFTWDNVNGATNYLVDDISGNGGIIIGNSYMVSGLTNGEEVIIEITAFGNNACGSTSVQASCSADDCPNISVEIDHVDPICLSPNSLPFNFIATSFGGNGNGNMTWSGDGITDSAIGTFDPNLVGVGIHDITVAYEESNCFYLDVVTIEIFETPIADFSVIDIICINDNSTITYLGTANSNATYDWNFDGGNIISGTGVGPYEINWSAEGNYNITLAVEENGCQSDVFSQLIQVDPELSLPFITCESTTQSVTFSWDDVPGATSYLVTEISGPSGIQNGNSYEITGLATGQEVIIEVTAISNSACGNTTVQAICNAENCPTVDVEVESISDICLTSNSPLINLISTITSGNNLGTLTWLGTGITDSDLGIFNPNIAGVGMHNIICTYEQDNCTFSDFIIINIFETPTSNFSVDENICLNENSTIAYLGTASSNANFSWDFDGGSIVSGSGVGPYEISWTNSGNYNITLTVIENGCQSDMFSQIVQVDAEIETPTITCETTTNSIVFSWDDVAGADNYLITDLSGIAGVQNGNTYSFNSLNPGQEVSIEVTVLGNSICGNPSIIATCSANDCPDITLNLPPVDDICLDNLTSDIPLQSIVNGSDGTGIGSWSGVGIINDIFDPNEAGEGQHELTFSFTESGCDFSESIIVNIDLQPNAVAGDNGNLDCLETFFMLNGSNSSPFGSPIWTTNSGNFVNGNNTIISEVNASGIYYLTIENGGCSSVDSVVVTQNITSPIADAGTQKTLTCDVSCVVIGGGNTSIGGNFIYSWSSLNGFNSSEISPQVCESGEYILTVLDTLNNCISASSSVVILEDTNSPFSIIEPIENLDCNTTALVLNGNNSSNGIQFEYQWFDDDGEIIGETNSTYEVAEQGNYYLQVSNISTGCFSIDTILVNDLTAYPIAEINLPEILTCINTEVILDATISSNSSDITFNWNEPNGGIQSGEDTNQPTVILPGTYEIVVTDNSNGCETAAIVNVIQNIVSPNADAGLDIELECNETEAMLGSENTSSGINFIYQWTSSNPSVIISNPTDLNPMVNGLGIYYLMVTNMENGCTSMDEMEVSQSPNIPQNINLEITESPCFGDDQGSIMIPSIDGGMQPYLYSLNGAPFTSTNFYNNLITGDYEILIQDANGCELSTVVTLDQPDSLSIDLGENIYIELGDSVMLEPLMTGLFDTIFWESNSTFTNCDSLTNCYYPIVTPTQLTSMEATIINDNGCIATDQVLIYVEKNRNVYIPNAFSPEGNLDNQMFMIYAGKGVEKINKFKIYSRWGEQLYEANNFLPNDRNYGWNGNFKGKKMNSGVYVYFAEIEFSDGLKKIYKGDVTLTR